LLHQSSEQHWQQVNAWYDAHHLQLIHGVHQRIHQLTTRQSPVSPQPSMQQALPSVQECPVPSGHDASSSQLSPPYTPPSSASTSPSDPSEEASVPSPRKLLTFKRKTIIKPLNEKATKVLNDWYEAQSNVYPTHEQAERLAQEADITVKQVRKWLCNRRGKDKRKAQKAQKAIAQNVIATSVNMLM
jgi:hypothetical protein